MATGEHCAGRAEQVPVRLRPSADRAQAPCRRASRADRRGGRSRCTGSPRPGSRRSARCTRPHGFNLGWNIGRVAGAGIEDHVHLHVVPRWNGDTNFMPVLGDVKVLPEALLETAGGCARRGRPMTELPLTGGCLCGGVRYELDQPPVLVGLLPLHPLPAPDRHGGSDFGADRPRLAPRRRGRGARPRLDAGRRRLPQMLLRRVRRRALVGATRPTPSIRVRPARNLRRRPRGSPRSTTSSSRTQRPGSRSRTTACRAIPSAGRFPELQLQPISADSEHGGMGLGLAATAPPARAAFRFLDGREPDVVLGERARGCL